MNNGKVRIYDLSKELNLDNKELLAICDQLNIAVKSHSSTISEGDAKRIRMAAEKQAAAMTAARRESAVTNSRGNAPAPTKARPTKAAAPHKQQILEIRKPKIIDRNHVNSSEPTVSPAPQSPVRPSPPAPPAAPMKLSAPSQPEVPASPPVTNETEPEVTSQTAAPQPESSAEILPKPTPPERLRLSAPPERQESLSAPPVQLNQPERPILRRNQANRAASQVTEPAARESSVEKPTIEKPVRRAAEAPRPEPATPRAKPPLELNRPTRPTRTAEPAAAQSLNDITAEPAADAEELLDDSTTLLKRPTPPRPVKGAKKWQEEEDERQEAASKASKLGVKGKRMKPIVVEDDEDFDEDDSSAAAETVQVSLSIARPPRQKTARPSPSSPAVTSAPAAPVRGKKSPSSSRDNRHREPEPKQERPEKLVITSNMTVQELAQALAVQDTEIIRVLFMKGVAVNITQNLDVPTITLVAKELGVEEVETAEPEAEARKVTEMLDEADLEKLQRRPPVVTIMGHVDHGKTTLLDAIRKTKVAQGEAGGITQHIGAYHVDVEQNGQIQQVVFLDTPGHEAFTAMRARGARVTDLAILVVAADDGVRPQTIEAISHAQAAEVPIVVAINKIDKEGAQSDRVKQELMQHGLTAEEWGGDTIMVPVSAIKGENLDTLLEMILLVTEVEELSANPDRNAKGTVIEAHLDKAKGPVATLLVQNGTLRVSDVLVAGSAFGKVRAMVDDRGQRVEAASPSFAVEVLGLSDVPAAGDEFEVFDNEKVARATAAARADQQRMSRLLQGRATLTALSAQAQEGELKELNLILKADVQGSVEAIIGALKQLPQDEVQIRLLLAAPGEVTETDIDLAAASDAVIIGFNTTLASGARQAADEAGVDVREYEIIYKLLEDIQGALEGLLEPELVEEPLGQTEVRAVFPVGRGKVAGCYVQSGRMLRNCKVRVRRHNQVVYEGTLDSLKRMRDDVREVSAGYECGVGIDKFNDWEEGDIIEAFQLVTRRRSLTLTR